MAWSAVVDWATWPAVAPFVGKVSLIQLLNDSEAAASAETVIFFKYLFVKSDLYVPVKT